MTRECAAAKDRKYSHGAVDGGPWSRRRFAGDRPSRRKGHRGGDAVAVFPVRAQSVLRQMHRRGLTGIRCPCQSRLAPCDINGEPAAPGFPDLDRASDRPEHFSLPTADSTLLLPMMRFGSRRVQAPEIAESNRLIECGNGLEGAPNSVSAGDRA